MERQSKFTFIGGPSIVSLKSREERRRLRSRVVTRAIHERNSTSTQVQNSDGLAIYKTIEDIELLARAPGRKIFPATAIFTEQTPPSVALHHVPKMSGEKRTSTAVFLSGLGRGRKDPFGVCYPPASEDELCHKLVDYCINTMWPGWRTLDDYSTQIYRSLMPLAALNSHVHYAFLHCASTHLVSRSGLLGGLQQEQIRYGCKALQSIRQVISSGIKFDVEALITAMVFLAMNNEASRTLQYDPNPFTPPFTDVQWLSHYARSELQPAHWSAIQIMIEKYGGVEKLTVFAIPWLLSYASLVQAAVSFSGPVYPLLQPNGKPYLHVPPAILLRELHGSCRDQRDNSGFRYLQFVGVRESLVEVFVSLSELSQVIQLLNDGSENPLYVDRIGDCRNLVQHKLLSLPAVEDPHELILKDHTATRFALSLYDACRLTAFLYSTHVTFPVPRTASQRESMLGSHREKILTIDPHITENIGALQLLLWCTVIGGIVSDRRQLRSWYAREAKKLFRMCGIGNLSQIREVMEHFAWMEKACSSALRSFVSDIGDLPENDVA